MWPLNQLGFPHNLGATKWGESKIDTGDPLSGFSGVQHNCKPQLKRERESERAGVVESHEGRRRRLSTVKATLQVHIEK